MTRLYLLSASVMLFLASGCNGGGPDVSYVEGVVTLDGQPVEGVVVGFSPVNETGIPAVGTTDANGVYKLTSTQSGQAEAGAAPGDYNVTFFKATDTGGGSTVTSSEDPNYGKIDYSVKPKSSTVEYVVPQKYMNPATSGFKVTVKRGTNKGDEFNFDLKKE